MSQYGSKSITKQQESRISTLEKRQADHLSEAENGAPIPSPFRLEGPRDVITLFEEAVSLVRNDTRSTDLAKGQGLISIAVKAAGILPLVEAAKAQAKDWEKIYREQEVWTDIVSRNPKTREIIKEMWDLEFEVKELAEKRYQAKLRSENELQPAPEEKEGRDTW
jgi:hypothetical protein